MDPELWLERWRAKQIGFHEDRPNSLLVGHLDELALTTGDRIFLPLCGNTLDVGWLLAKGFEVCGVELSRQAVEALFTELGIRPEITDSGELTRFRAEQPDILVGDVFELSTAILGAVDAVYDRAAAQLREITDTARQLLICLEYDQSLMAGPPFSVPRDEIFALYGDHYPITKTAEQLEARLQSIEKIQ